jgi:ABC-type lipoprotein release transport system permease subunit
VFFVASWRIEKVYICMDLWLLAWKNLWRNKRRTLITLAAIGLSMALVQAFHNLSSGVYARMVDAGVRAGSGHLVLYQQGYAATRDEKRSFALADLQQQVGNLPGVEAALPRIYLPGLAQSSRESRGILLTGVDPLAEQRVNPFLKGLGEDQRLRGLDSRDAILGNRLLRELKLKPGQKLVITLQSRAGELASELFRIRGVIETGLKEIDGSLIMVGRERAAALAGMNGEIHELAVVLQAARDERRVLPPLRQLIEDRPQVELLSWDRAMPNLANAIKLDYASQKFIFFIILLIVTIGVVNTLLMSVMERIREFGVILAVGATPGRLRKMILAEALLLGVCALAVGCLLGSLGTWYLVEVGIDLRQFVSETLEFGGVIFEPVLRARWDLAYMAQIAGYVLLLSIFAALYPAVKAGRITPVEAMRHH